MTTLLVSDINRDEPGERYVLNLVKAVIALARARGIWLSADNFVYTLNRDILGRIEICIGFRFFNGKIISSEKFVVYEYDVIRAYAGDGDFKEFLNVLGEFIARIIESKESSIELVEE